MNMPALKTSQIHQAFYSFINEEVLPLVADCAANGVGLNQQTFWDEFESLVAEFTPRNQTLSTTRNNTQATLDVWRAGSEDTSPQDISIHTANIDREIASIRGSQKSIDVANAALLLNATNARWVSLYEGLIGTNAKATSASSQHQAASEMQINNMVAYTKNLLDEHFPLDKGSHKNVKHYVVYYRHLLAFFADGTHSGLATPCQFVALCGPKSEPDSIVLKRKDLHIELRIDRSGNIGAKDSAGIQDVLIESALTSILDFTDTSASLEANDKIVAYRNWLGLMQGDLRTAHIQEGQQQVLKLAPDLTFTATDGEDYPLSGRSLMLVRCADHFMNTPLMQDEQGNYASESIVDTVVTSLIALLDLQKSGGLRNSRTGSIYMAKQKLHNPLEVGFTRDLFAAVEQLLAMPANTLKLVITNEPSLNSANVAACIEEAKERIVFINTTPV